MSIAEASNHKTRVRGGPVKRVSSTRPITRGESSMFEAMRTGDVPGTIINRQILAGLTKTSGFQGRLMQ